MNPRSETKRIMLHCTATPEGREVTYDDLWNWHVKGNGWSHIGYHWLIQLDGTVVACRPEPLQGAGCSGQNHDTVHITYAGGLEAGTNRSKDTRTPAQTAAMIDLIRDVSSRYKDIDDARDIVGHNQFAAKDCPCFSVPDWVDSVIANGEGGNPEPEMPEIDNLIQFVQDLEERIAALEAHNNAWEDRG